ncbi:MAG: RyR domain-containing protein, partial [Candidatus Hodarchaeales archaeon]
VFCQSRIGKLAIALGDWQKTIDVLSKFTHTKCSPVLRDLGVAICKKYSTKPKSSQYRRGQKHLERAIASDPYDVDAICSLAGTYKDIDNKKVLEYYRKAFQVDPSNPYPLVNYLQCEICAQKNIGIISITKPVIEAAICRCYDQAHVGVNLPWAFYNIGKLQLLLGRPYESLETYAKAISVSSASFMIETGLKSLRNLIFLHDQLLGIDWVEKLLLIGLITRFKKTANKQWIRKVMSMALINSRPFRPPVVMMIGGCDSDINKEMNRYKQLMMNSFRNFHGTIISRGITSGISGIVGNLQQNYPDAVDTIGYLPRKLPKNAKLDKRYKKILKTEGSDFTLLENLQSWIDIIASGIKPAEVKIIGINGGTIAAAEYRIALALGAKVAVIEKSGREVTRLNDDEDWIDAKNLISLIGDSASINTFINYGRFGLPTKIREKIAKAIHEEYRKNQNKRLLEEEPSMAGWNKLIETLKQSNRSQADQIFGKLQEFNYSVRQVRGRKISLRRFTKREIEIMAEIEHARWNVERLLNGWKWSPEKDVEKKLTPYLVSWEQLPEDIKELDRQAVRAIPKLLSQVGLEIYRQRKGQK